GSAGGGSPSDAGWATIGNNTINDPNIVYSLHLYSGIVESPQQQDAKWGPILNQHPIYYGEWALLTNGYGAVGYDHCKNIPQSQANQIVNAFLSYMASRSASWTAWEFTPYHLIQDYTSFTPTTLNMPWTCGDINSHAGMGTLVKQFLVNGA
ncbi:MAG TPA: cellulase family glycosylhydrolase, partial [Ktedonobacteraceae bacterium]|nr:cellulase family glycosylhydrolase [Ktedonobacteraceae bacterium]